MKNKTKINKKEGFVALISILIVGAVGLLIASSLLLLGIGFSRTILLSQQANSAMSLADSCIEEALLEIRESEVGNSSGSNSFSSGSCLYNIESTGGEGRIITAKGETEFAKRKVKVIISDINPKILVWSWQEVGDY